MRTFLILLTLLILTLLSHLIPQNQIPLFTIIIFCLGFAVHDLPRRNWFKKKPEHLEFDNSEGDNSIVYKYVFSQTGEGLQDVANKLSKEGWIIDIFYPKTGGMHSAMMYKC